MKTNEILDQSYGSDIQLTSESIGFLKETARWANFLSILGFIGIGIMVLAGVGIAAMSGFSSEMQSAFPFPASTIHQKHLQTVRVSPRR